MKKKIAVAIAALGLLGVLAVVAVPGSAQAIGNCQTSLSTSSGKVRCRSWIPADAYQAWVECAHQIGYYEWEYYTAVGQYTLVGLVPNTYGKWSVGYCNYGDTAVSVSADTFE